MNVAIIFAGGTGVRMNTVSKPKQFLELHGKPIIVYTMEHFQKHSQIDGIIVVCVEGWLDYCRELIDKYSITKVSALIAGGETGMLSRYKGVMKAKELYPDDTICLMHDGVRPLIDEKLISDNIKSVQEYGSAVTAVGAIETIAMKNEEGMVGEIVDRSRCMMAKAPQSFYLKDMYDAHVKAVESGMEDCIDTAFLMQWAGHGLRTVECSTENIKITTPMDFYMFRAIMDARENLQIIGV